MVRYTLVPQAFIEGDKNKILPELVQQLGTDEIIYKELPDYKAVLVYGHSDTDDCPEVLYLLEKSCDIKDYNKILVHKTTDQIHIVIATGKHLLLCNSYNAPDEVTSTYYIFATLKEFQINPEVSTIYFKGKDSQLRSEMFRYFKNVEGI